MKKLLQRPLIRAILRSVPFVGDVVDNLDKETMDSPKGTFDPGDMTTKLIRLAVLVGLMYFVFSGKLSMEEAESAKSFISN